MTTGYSGTPLVRKLGIKPGHRVLFDGAPDGFAIDGVETADGGPYDVVLLFTTSRDRLERELPGHEDRIERDGAIWVAWPKRASKVPTDMTENVVRDVALPRGLVDVKVCAIDEVWSGLKLVIRKENR
ncbi:DUF3052 family protein [Jiangella anatolica]|uniref:DUF3052 domain-containing protein n=1 Tax=Jiangella anatolica TaxID=2670374 RepID=A0A2W2C1G8_9ACTN|nr:DUF3052 family protein [Jiangella anatolica]PZF79576.1 DUF3052 domain-containing protein [Jiangella anatolica]